MTPAHIRSALRIPDWCAGLLDELAAIERPRAFDLPRDDAARDLLARLDVPYEFIGEIVETMPTPESAEAWWLLERLHHRLLGKQLHRTPWPAPSDDPLVRWFRLYPVLGAIPEALRRHAQRGVPERVSWDTLSDIGTGIRWHVRRHGHGGFAREAAWISQHVRGGFYRLGRLQFNFSKLAFDAGPCSEGEDVLGVHIPAIGPLDPTSCDESFREAPAFFARHFPERADRVATCGSWLLDEQLAEYLPATSNIIKFQRRFDLAPTSHPGDDDVQSFVFGRVPATLDEVPQRTTLERTVVAHLRSGRHWAVRDGWIELPAR